MAVALLVVGDVADVPRRVDPPVEAAGTAGGASSVSEAWGPAVGSAVTSAVTSAASLLPPPPVAEPDAVPVADPVAEPPTSGEVAIVPPPEQFDAAAPPAGAAPAALAGDAPAGVASGVGTWAVSIGIDDYPGQRHDLRSAVADAVEVDGALAGYGVPAHQRLVLADHAATADTIERAVAWLVANAGPEAKVVLFYAGHVRKLGPSTEALVAADGHVVTDDRLAELLAPLAARKAWIAVAACYGGGFTEVLAPGRILTAASGADELAYENLDIGRSYLIEYMVRRAMVEGAAASSVEAAFAYAADAIAREHPNRMPVQHDRLDGELVLAAHRGTPPAPRPTPSGPPAPPPPPDQEPPPERCLLGLLRCKD